VTDHPETAHLHLRWRKSTRSQSNAGANCIEVAAWRKSFRSQSSTGQCVEVGSWHTSSKSGGGQNCVEAGACGCHGVAIRDTKHHASGTLAVTTGEWSRLLSVLKEVQ